MSIASEISRLQGAKADIKTAIQGKGVTVPSAAKLDDYADYIDDIPQGTTPTGTKQISVISNGTQTENVSGYASAQLNVDVPNSYSAGDEGKVVSNGALVAQGSDTVTANDTYDTTLINSLTVNVSGGGGYTDNEYANNTAPRGEMNISSEISTQVFFNNNGITKVTQTANGCNARAFQGCTSLRHFIGKGTSFFYAQVFKGCSNLEAVDVGNAYNWRFELENFAQCLKLATLIIRTNAVIAIANENVLLDSPFASSGKGGTLYVPSALISSYQTASNWSTILGYTNNQIKSIESTHTDPNAPIDLTRYYADGTLIPT